MAPLTPMTSPVYVEQPPVGSIRYGLWSAAVGPLPMPTHGEIGGVQYLEEHCGVGHLWPAASCSPATLNSGLFPLDGCDGTAIGLPFQAIATYKSGPWPYSEEEFTRRVRVRHQDNAQYVTEQAFWGGNADVQSVLASSGLGFTNSDITPTPGTPVTIEYGVGLLEDFLAQYSYPGVFHARPLVSPYATERLLSVPDKGSQAGSRKYLTPMGNQWSFGRGYSGNKPNNEASTPTAGTAYIQATGVVTVWQDPKIFTNPVQRSMDRSANQYQVTAQQAYALTVDCVAAFVLVELDGMTRGTGTTTAATLY